MGDPEDLGTDIIGIETAGGVVIETAEASDVSQTLAEMVPDFTSPDMSPDMVGRLSESALQSIKHWGEISGSGAASTSSASKQREAYILHAMREYGGASGYMAWNLTRQINIINQQIAGLDKKITETKDKVSGKESQKAALLKITDTEKKLETNKEDIKHAETKVAETGAALAAADKAITDSKQAADAATAKLFSEKLPELKLETASLTLEDAFKPRAPNVIAVQAKLEGDSMSSLYTVSKGEDGKYYVFSKGHDSMLGAMPAKPDGNTFSGDSYKPLSLDTSLSYGSTSTASSGSLYSGGLSYGGTATGSGTGYGLGGEFKPLFSTVGATEITDPALIAKIKEQEGSGGVFANSSKAALTEAQKLDRESLARTEQYKDVSAKNDKAFDAVTQKQTCQINHDQAKDELKILTDKRTDLQEQLDKLNKENPGNEKPEVRAENIKNLETEIGQLNEKIKTYEKERADKVLTRDNLIKERDKCLQEANTPRTPSFTYNDKQAELERSVENQVEGGKISADNLAVALKDATPEQRDKILKGLEAKGVEITGDQTMLAARPSIFGGAGTKVAVSEPGQNLPVLTGDRSVSFASNLDGEEKDSKMNMAFNKAASPSEPEPERELTNSPSAPKPEQFSMA